MCTSPLIRYRLKCKPISISLSKYPFLCEETYDTKNKGFKILSKKKLSSYFKSNASFVSFMDTYCDYIEIPCGKCYECKKAYARDWSVRCYHESLTSERSCFITLTIDKLANARFMDEIEKSYNRGTNRYCRYCVNGNKYYRYPIDYSLNKPFIYSWLKRFRDYLYRTYGLSIRYFGVGEYGSKTDRPHYHILIFGYDFPNVRNGCTVYRTFPVQMSEKGVQMFISEELQKLWKYGYSYVEELNLYSCMYVAKYCMKKIKFIDSEDLYDYYYGREPEFLFMSKGNCQANRCKYIDEIIKNCRGLNSLRNFSNPYCKKCSKTRGGLGFQWLLENIDDIRNLGYLVIDGKKFPVPKYYKNLIKLTDDKLYDKLQKDIIYYVNSQKEKDINYNSVERLENRKIINKRKNEIYNVRDID